jgi:hypothetical protein
MDPTKFYGKGKQGGVFLPPANATVSDAEETDDSEPEIFADNIDDDPDFVPETDTNGLLVIPESDSASDSASDSEERVDNVPLTVPSTSNNTSGQKKKSVNFDWVKSDIEATTADLSPVFDSEETPVLQALFRHRHHRNDC